MTKARKSDADARTARGHRKPATMADAMASFLAESGLAHRIEQNNAVAAWPEVAGKQIAQVTEPRVVTQDGTLFVSVKTAAWMNELSLMSPDLVRRINEAMGHNAIKRIRFQLMR